MAKELYLYSPIYDGVAQELIAGMNDNMGKEVTMRVNSPGGRVLAHWGIIAKMKEHGKVNLKIDGGAFSAAANMVLYADKVSALDVSQFMFHRADMYVETEDDKKFLETINADLKSRMLSKIDSSKLLAMKGVSVDRMFDMTQERVDVYLTAKQMKELGLINEVVEVNPSEVTAFNERFFKIAAESPTPPTPQKTDNVMTIEELKSKFPAVYQQILAEGVAQEKDRVGAVMVYAHLDLDGAKKIIASGKPMTQTEQAEFGLKLMSAQALKAVKDEAAEDVTTEEAPQNPKAAKQKEIENFEKKIRATMGLEKTDGATILRKGSLALVTEA